MRSARKRQQLQQSLLSIISEPETPSSRWIRLCGRRRRSQSPFPFFTSEAFTSSAIEFFYTPLSSRVSVFGSTLVRHVCVVRDLSALRQRVSIAFLRFINDCLQSVKVPTSDINFILLSAFQLCPIQ